LTSVLGSLVGNIAVLIEDVNNFFVVVLLRISVSELVSDISVYYDVDIFCNLFEGLAVYISVGRREAIFVVTDILAAVGEVVISLVASVRCTGSVKFEDAPTEMFSVPVAVLSEIVVEISVDLASRWVTVSFE